MYGKTIYCLWKTGGCLGSSASRIKLETAERESKTITDLSVGYSLWNIPNVACANETGSSDFKRSRSVPSGIANSEYFTAIHYLVGVGVGVAVGDTPGVDVGVTVGNASGVEVGVAVGDASGVEVGFVVGFAVGVGLAVGEDVGSGDGCVVGADVGCFRISCASWLSLCLSAKSAIPVSCKPCFF